MGQYRSADLERLQLFYGWYNVVGAYLNNVVTGMIDVISMFNIVDKETNKI